MPKGVGYGVNQSGFSVKETKNSPKGESGLGGMSAGPGALGGAKMKTDPMQRKPRKHPKGPGISTKG